MTHQRPKTDGVGLAAGSVNEVTGDRVIPAPPIGITDLTNAVDSRSAAVKAAEDFSACEIRCYLMHGQLLAELGRLKELSYALDRERADAVIRVQAIAVPAVKADHD